MSATIGKVSATFTSNTSGLLRGVNDAVRAFQKMDRTVAKISGALAKVDGAAAVASLKRVDAGVSGVRRGVGALTAIAGAQLFSGIVSGAVQAANALRQWIQTSAEAIDKQSKLAARLGVTYGEMAGLSLAADLAGVSVDQVAGAMTRADRALVQAQNGNKAASNAFRTLGLSIDELSQMSAAERFDAIAQAISDLPDPASRAAAAIALFGRAGAQLLPLFSEGSGAIRQASQDAQAFGLNLTNVQGRNVEAMNDAFTRAGAAVQGIVNQVTAFLAPAVQNVVDVFTNFIADVGGANLGQAIGEGILEGALTLARIADDFISGFANVWEFGRQVAEGWNATWDLGGRLFSFFSGIVNGLQAGLGAIILGFGKIAELFLKAASAVSEALGLGGFDQTIAGIEGFNQQIFDDMVANANAAANDFANTFGEATRRAADDLPGPFETAVIDGIAAAREAAASIDQAVPRQIEAQVQIETKKQAVQGIESTSAEGIKEMFRIMRGETGNESLEIQKQQAEILGEIRDGIEEMNGGDPEFAVVGF